MKIVYVLILSMIFFFARSVQLYSQTVIPEEIYIALKNGDSKKLANHFNANIYLVIPGIEGVYSRTQSTLILRDFFAHHVPNNYIKLRESGKGASKCVIGVLYTSKGKYRVVFIHKNAGPAFIDQFRIENDNEIESYKSN